MSDPFVIEALVPPADHLDPSGPHLLMDPSGAEVSAIWHAPICEWTVDDGSQFMASEMEGWTYVAPYVAPMTHGRRVSGLIEANNREVERRRKAEAAVRSIMAERDAAVRAAGASLLSAFGGGYFVSARFPSSAADRAVAS